MSELENLTKTLLQVVGSLQQFISKRGTAQSTLQPEAPRLKKTPQMTYNEFVKRVLANRKPIQVNSKKASFKLQEDLLLLSQLSNHNQISIKTFEQISKTKKLNRTTDALRSRYHDFLYRIDEKQMKRIVAWIQKEGLQGYLIWEEDDMNIQHHDPNQHKQEKKRQRQPDSKKEKISKRKNVPTNCKQLSEVLKLYSKMVNYPVKTLVEKLDQLSGDLVALDNYIQTKDARMLWTQQQDDILRKGGPELQILKRYRKDGVQTRKTYLGIN